MNQRHEFETFEHMMSHYERQFERLYFFGFGLAVGMAITGLYLFGWAI